MPEEASDFQTRKAAFIKEYGELVTKYKCDSFPHPIFTPTPMQDAQTRAMIPVWSIVMENEIIDTTEQPIKSPFSV